MLSDSIIALIRTVVPAVVGSMIAIGIDAGIGFEEGAADSLSAALIPLCLSLYYALATYLERNVDSRFGWFLGNPKAPTYLDSE
jgi:hypothetical protein